jgi:hypothetical protein
MTQPPVARMTVAPAGIEIPSGHQIHVHASYLPCVRRELAADLVAHDGLATDFLALARVGKQVADRLG